MTSFWPEHPLFSAESRQKAEAGLDVFTDGLIALGGHGEVVSINTEAARMLRLSVPDRGSVLTALNVGLDGWESVLEAVSAGRRGDVGLRGDGGRPLLATLTCAAGTDHIQWIILRDVEAFEFRRDRSFGRPQGNNIRFLSSERTRPDFATQRQLCPEINRLLSRGERAVRQGARILITGESGVGKSEVARFLHSAVADARDPFVVVNCASSSEAHFDTLLFGRDDQNGQLRPGLIEQAESGTLFLDEVCEIPLSTQAKLLGFLEDGRLPHLAGATARPRRVRIISATNRDLRQMVREGRFRADLYFRLAIISLHVPPLRNLPPLINHLIDRFSRTINHRRQTPMMVPRRVREILNDYSFPGNIRELLNIVQRLAIFIDDSEDVEEILAEMLAPIDIPNTDNAPDAPNIAGTPTLDLRTEVRRFERALIDKAIRIHGSKRKAAKALGVDIGTVVRKTANLSNDPSTRQPINRGSIK